MNLQPVPPGAAVPLGDEQASRDQGEHSSTKDLLNAFVGEKRRFDKPVVVALSPDGRTKVIGFVTQESLDQLGLAGHVAVYLPQSYNFAGNLLLFPAEHVQRLAAESAAVMAFIISGGVAEMAGREVRRSGRQETVK